MAAGRPPKYKKSFHPKKAQEHLAKGYSIYSLAGLFNVVPSTINKWKETHAEFSDSVSIGRSKGEEWYLSKARDMIAGTNKGSDPMLRFMLKNQYAGWSENPNATENENKININFNKID